MYKILVILSCFSQIHTNCLPKTELVFTFMLCCHGDLAPFKNLLNFTTLPTPLGELVKALGSENISDIDNDRFYQLGKYVRKRYGSLMTPTFEPDNLVIRSSFSRDIITSTSFALAGIYNIEKSLWMTTLNWIPLAYSTVLPKYDYNAAYINCPTFITDLVRTSFPLSVLQSLRLSFHSVFNTLVNEFGFKNNDIYDLNYVLKYVPLVYNVINRQINLGQPCSNTIMQQLPKMKSLTSYLLQVYLANPKRLPLQSGALVHEFFRMADLVISGRKFPKVYIHAGHGFNLYSFLGATKATPIPGPLPFASLYALEFRKEIPTGKYFVQPVYFSQLGQPETLLSVDGCGGSCEFSKFKSLTSPYALDINQWRSECGFSENMNIDSCALD